MSMDKILLFPYYLTLAIRNKAYDKGWFKSYKSSIPVICMGNITVGGTGKTPHIEQLVRLFKDEYRIAVVSRGYGRKTKGFREVACTDSFRDVGDEPLQIKRKFPDITVIVDESRREAIEILESRKGAERPTLILLDDAFQHRKVRPDVSVLLVNYNRPVFSDSLLPLGRLRDLRSQVKRADIVIVTKVPVGMDYDDEKYWRTKLKLTHRQDLFFTAMINGDPQPVFPDCDRRYLYSKSAIAFSGIANPEPFNLHIRNLYHIKENIAFGDHHPFRKRELRHIASVAQKNQQCLILTTEKDSQRLLGLEVPEIIRKRIACIPTIPKMLPVGNASANEYEEERMELVLQQYKNSLKKHITPKI